MNQKTVGMAVAMCMVVAGAAATLASAADKVIDSTNTTFGWQVLNDKPPAPTFEAVAGPAKKSNALQLDYQFTDGIWIAVVKNVNLSIGANEAIQFSYKGSGATVNVKVKVSDAAGTVFGYTVPSGSVTEAWKKVVIARGDFGYLWGGSGEKGMNWSNIAKLEITLDTDKMNGVDYTVDTSKPGKIAIYNLKLVSTKAN